ncbi:hypothetical protein E1B28_010668 [Marasmius oreades]|uniref:Uncharacterized protein n=1 Tax=Marasmius oreades TaxID=181124 RepID=A0A9P7RXS5_9AGAR|nr:uncharacterized protein E1B28_010668 [Marasmius oreades]KAG7091647.1 hypothetical protein E1B28_010668 [Marasmius oreades]
MQYHGGGVGHPTCKFTHNLEAKAMFKDSPLPVYDCNTGIIMVRSLSLIDEVLDEMEEDVAEEDNQLEEEDNNDELWPSEESDSSEDLSADGYTSQDNDLDKLKDF